MEVPRLRRHRRSPVAGRRGSQSGGFGARLCDGVVDPPVAIEQRLATRHYYQINWNGRRIWGATAAMLVNLRLRLEALESSNP